MEDALRLEDAEHQEVRLLASFARDGARSSISAPT